MSSFSEVVERADELSVDEQQTLIEILRRRIAERKRAEIVRDVKEARSEFSRGQSRTATAGQIMDEVRGEP